MDIFIHLNLKQFLMKNLDEYIVFTGIKIIDDNGERKGNTKY